jgi:imidazole glycerol-phosphate synthase subunit HisH
MSKKLVALIDYGAGNLLSVKRAMEHLGFSVVVTTNSSEVEKADFLVLPGVGAYKSAMKVLGDKSLISTIKKYSEDSRPLLGICLGMQLLLDSSQEFGDCQGLGIIQGSVKKLPSQFADGKKIRVPSIGWFQLQSAGNNDAYLVDRNIDKFFYFAHSYASYVEDELNCIAKYTHSDLVIPAIIRQKNTYGLQFHPEKSGIAGLEIIEQFLKI